MNTALRGLMVLAAGMLCAATALAGGAAESGGAAAEVTAATEATVPGKEAPLLAEMVKRGLIPPLEERLPEEPMVVKPLHEPGRYGGTVLMPSTRTDRAMDAHWVFLNFAGGIMPDAENFAPTTPDLAKSFDLSPDGRIFTLTLRKGLKWSDGEPFTTDDILYRYEHELLNEELTPRPGGILTLHGEPIELQQVDEQTVRLIFPQPNPVILEQMATHVGLVHEWASPAHFFKELHAEFAGTAAANRNARDAGFDNWYDYYWDRYPRTYSNQTLPGQGPVLNPYLLVDKSESRWIYERNPYYWRVDQQGRQLPYIDRVIGELVENNEIVAGKVISGELDMSVMYNDLLKMPLYMEHRGRGNYQVLEWQAGSQNVVILQPNHSIEKPQLRALFNEQRFKHALSLAIDRQAISEQVFFGFGEPLQFTVNDNTPWFKPEYASAYVDYDAARAQQLLREIGLRKNAEGLWVDQDGQEISWTIEYEVKGLPVTEILEIVVENWRDIGLQVAFKQIDKSLRQERVRANLIEMSAEGASRTVTLSFPVDPFQFTIVRRAGHSFPGWIDWVLSKGEEGVEPSPAMKAARAAFEKLQASVDLEDKIRWGREILDIQADQLWAIGTIGKLPHPVIVNTDLRNVPKEGLWTSAVRGLRPYHPEQFFFATRPAITYEESRLPALYGGR